MLLRVAFAECDITPPLGLPLGGYGARTATADGVLDPLACRAVALDDGSSACAIVVLDLVHVRGSWVDVVRAQIAAQLGLAPASILIAATHTHAGPGVFRSSLVSDARVRVYEGDLADRVTACVGAARRAAAPAELRFGCAAAPGVAANRRAPTEPIDHTVRVLSMHAPDGRLLGVLANFACHPTVLSAANCSYSGDLFGAAAARASHDLGAPVVITNGAAGDVSTRFTRREQTHAEVQRLGHGVAAALCAAVKQAAPVHSGPLAAATGALPISWRQLRAPDVVAADLQAALAQLEEMRAGGADLGAMRLVQARVEGAHAELWVASHGGWPALLGARRPEAAVQALRCGSASIVAAPGELFSAAGQWLLGQLGAHSIVVGYANDYLGYFIPEPEARAGGYESLVAMVDPACEAPLRQHLIDVARAAGGAAAATAR